MIIGIETSSPEFSIALAEGDKVIREVRKDRRIHGPSRDAGLFEDIHDLIKDHGHQAVEAIAISIGPGLFTSLRVGLSLAKGLAFSWGKPLVAVNTLDILGMNSNHVAGQLVAVIDARNNELYAAIYKEGTRISDYQLTKPEALIRSITGKWTATGSGIGLLADHHHLNAEVNFIEPERFQINAVKVIELSIPNIRNRVFENMEDLEPFYLKRTDAERNRNKTDEIQ